MHLYGVWQLVEISQKTKLESGIIKWMNAYIQSASQGHCGWPHWSCGQASPKPGLTVSHPPQETPIHLPTGTRSCSPARVLIVLHSAYSHLLKNLTLRGLPACQPTWYHSFPTLAFIQQLFIERILMPDPRTDISERRVFNKECLSSERKQKLGKKRSCGMITVQCSV